MNNKERAINEIGSSKCIALTTFKRDGSRISTPIWFNVMDGKIYVTTETGAWKVKRIANNPNVELAAVIAAKKRRHRPEALLTRKLFLKLSEYDVPSWG